MRLNPQHFVYSFLFLTTFSVCLSCTNLHSKDEVFAYSTLPALANAVYNGDITTNYLKCKGDFGLGTFNGLDGELIMLNNTIYQVQESGQVVKNKQSDIPFAVVTNFNSDTTFIVRNITSYHELQFALKNTFKSNNYPIAVKLHGTMNKIRCGGAPKQNPPFNKNLSDVLKQRPAYNKNNTTGMLVGFWLPNYFTGINLTGFHLHFISDDENFGGHLIQLQADSLKVSADYKYGYHLQLPKNDLFKSKQIDLNNGYNK